MSLFKSRREQLQDELHGEEQHLKSAVGQLKESLQATVSPGRQAARFPYAALGLAVGIGFLLGVWPADTQD